MLNWFYFTVSAVLAYVSLSLFGKLSGGSATSALGSVFATFKPTAFFFLIVGNVLWAVAVFFGLRGTPYALPATIAIGIITSFFFSVVVLGTSITIYRLLGIVVILLGVYLLR